MWKLIILVFNSDNIQKYTTKNCTTKHHTTKDTRVNLDMSVVQTESCTQVVTNQRHWNLKKIRLTLIFIRHYIYKIIVLSVLSPRSFLLAGLPPSWFRPSFRNKMQSLACFGCKQQQTVLITRWVIMHGVKVNWQW